MKHKKKVKQQLHNLELVLLESAKTHAQFTQKPKAVAALMKALKKYKAK